MAVGVEELYCNLNKLLHDICKFLTDETNYEQLSPRARIQADELINRSKHQLQEIAKIKVDNQGCNGTYVDMERNSAGSNEEKNIYSSVEETVTNANTVIEEIQNPYANLPAKELLQNVKFGSLSWRCKIILKFEKMRRIYAGIHHNWLLIYSSEKDSKPIHTFDLKYHKAETVTSKQGKQFCQDFELISTVGEKKTQYFTALTHKDMLQWVAHINRCFDSLSKYESTSISEEDISETYYLIDEMKIQGKNETDEEAEYEDIKTLCSDRIKIESKPPDLPARSVTKPKMSIPPIPELENDQHSLSSVYDPVNITDSSSFSEEEEEAIYEPFVLKVPENNTAPLPRNDYVKNNDSEKGNSNSTESPKSPVKPKISKEKPLLLLKK